MCLYCVKRIQIFMSVLFLFSAFRHCSPCQLYLCHHRQEQQFTRPGGGTGHDWSGRVRHWRNVWLQLRLRHQPSQGSGTKNFHRHGWLGLWSIYVRFSFVCFVFFVCLIVSLEVFDVCSIEALLTGC